MKSRRTVEFYHGPLTGRWRVYSDGAYEELRRLKGPWGHELETGEKMRWLTGAVSTAVMKDREDSAFDRILSEARYTCHLGHAIVPKYTMNPPRFYTWSRRPVSPRLLRRLLNGCHERGITTKQLD